MPIVLSDQASHASILNCTIDGAGHDPNPYGALVAFSGTNGFTIKNCWLKNSGGDNIQTVGGSGLLTIEQNLFQNAA